MKTDFQYWYITQEDDGSIRECAIKYYEGDFIERQETDVDGVTKLITRYRRVKRLNLNDMPHRKGRAIRLDSKGNETFVYTKADFGTITTKEELDDYLWLKLKKDTVRTATDRQDVNKNRT